MMINAKQKYISMGEDIYVGKTVVVHERNVRKIIDVHVVINRP